MLLFNDFNILRELFFELFNKEKIKHIISEDNIIIKNIII